MDEEFNRLLQRTTNYREQVREMLVMQARALKKVYVRNKAENDELLKSIMAPLNRLYHTVGRDAALEESLGLVPIQVLSTRAMQSVSVGKFMGYYAEYKNSEIAVHWAEENIIDGQGVISIGFSRNFSYRKQLLDDLVRDILQRVPDYDITHYDKGLLLSDNPFAHSEEILHFSSRLMNDTERYLSEVTELAIDQTTMNIAKKKLREANIRQATAVARASAVEEVLFERTSRKLNHYVKKFGGYLEQMSDRPRAYKEQCIGGSSDLFDTAKFKDVLKNRDWPLHKEENLPYDAVQALITFAEARGRTVCMDDIDRLFMRPLNFAFMSGGKQYNEYIVQQNGRYSPKQYIYRRPEFHMPETHRLSDPEEPDFAKMELLFDKFGEFIRDYKVS